MSLGRVLLRLRRRDGKGLTKGERQGTENRVDTKKNGWGTGASESVPIGTTRLRQLSPATLELTPVNSACLYRGSYGPHQGRGSRGVKWSRERRDGARRRRKDEGRDEQRRENLIGKGGES